MEHQVAVVGVTGHAERSVGSRISWGAVLGGTATALGVYYLLGILTAAVGMSVRDGMTTSDLSTGSVVWLILVTSLAMFTGGFVTTVLTLGEDREESVLLGIITWATISSVLLLFGALGLKTGLNGVISVADMASRPTADWEQAARDNGVPQERINALKADLNNVAAKAQDPEARRQAREAATRYTWIAFAGVWISMFAAAAGAFVGMRPNLRFVPIYVSRRTTATA